MTSPLVCPSCGKQSRFTEVGRDDNGWILRCYWCNELTDDAELAAAQPTETCEEAVARMEQEEPVARFTAGVNSFAPGEWSEYAQRWINFAFTYPERIQITRMEVHNG